MLAKRVFRFFTSIIVAAFATPRSEDQDDIYLVTLKIAEQIWAFEAADWQETMPTKEMPQQEASLESFVPEGEQGATMIVCIAGGLSALI